MMPASPTATTPPATTCFARSMEEVRTADASAVQDDRSAAWKQAAAVATLVAFTVLGAAALVITGIVAPIYVPIVLITVGCLMDPAFQGYQYFAAQANELQETAQRTRDISEQYKSIQAEPAHIAMLRVSALRTNAYSLANLNKTNVEDCKPILAIYNYWQKTQTEHEVRAQAYIELAQKAQANNGAEITANYKMAKDEQRKSLIAKTTSAFYRAVIQNPTFVGEFNSMATFKDFNWASQALYRDFNDNRVNNVIEFTGSSPRPAISMHELQAQTVGSLAQRFLDAMPAA